MALKMPKHVAMFTPIVYIIKMYQAKLYISTKHRKRQQGREDKNTHSQFEPELYNRIRFVLSTDMKICNAVL